MTEHCPRCGGSREGTLRFCRSCGFDFDAAPAVAGLDPSTAKNPASAEAALRFTASLVQVVLSVVLILLLLSILGNIREIGIAWQPIGDGIGELLDGIGNLFR